MAEYQCPKCQNIISHSDIRTEVDNYYTFTCPRCQTICYGCKQCSSCFVRKFRFTPQHIINRHINHAHRNNAVTENQFSIDMGNTEEDSDALKDDQNNSQSEDDAGTNEIQVGNHSDTGLKDDQKGVGDESSAGCPAPNIFMGREYNILFGDSVSHDQDDVCFVERNYGHLEFFDEQEDNIDDNLPAPSNYLQTIITDGSSVQNERTDLPVFWNTVTEDEYSQCSRESIDTELDDCNSVPSFVSRGTDLSSVCSDESEIDDGYNCDDVTLKQIMKNESYNRAEEEMEAFRIGFDLLEVQSSEDECDNCTSDAENVNFSNSDPEERVDPNISDVEENVDLQQNVVQVDYDQRRTTYHGSLHDDGNVVVKNIYEPFSKFAIFDDRSPDEKLLRKNEKRNAVCQSSLYFFQKHQGMTDSKNMKTNRGYEGLCGRSNGGNTEDKNAMIKEAEARVVFKYQQVTRALPKSLKEDFVKMDNEKQDLFGFGEHADKVATHFPKDFNEFNNFVGYKKNSIWNMFPTQRVFIKNKHACVGLKQTILFLAAHHGRFQFAWDAATQTSNKDGLNGTDAVADLVNDIGEAMSKKGMTRKEIRNTNIGWVYFWSDSFLRCFVKQRENSVWIFTVTICPPYTEINSGRYTIVLAMGKSSDDHTGVIEHYHSEVKELMTGFDCYFGDRNEFGKMAVGLLFNSADRPERQFISQTRKEGTFGKASNRAIALDLELFPDCVHCYHKRASAVSSGNVIFQMPRCPHCFNWNADPNDKAQETIPVSANYPQRTIGNVVVKQRTIRAPKERMPGVYKIGPVDLSSDFLSIACLYAYEALRTKNWTKANFREYLRTCNVRDSRIDHIEYFALRDANKEEQDRASIKDLLPSVWLENNIFQRCRLPELPMHAIAHSMIPETMDFIHAVFTKWKKLTNYVTFANTIIDDLSSFNLDWLKIKPVPKKAWIGENSMGYMRVFSYLYGMYFLNANLNPEFNMYVKDLKRVINSFQAVISVLLSLKIPPQNTIDNLMKLFMSTLHHAHKRIGNLDKKKGDQSCEKGSKKDFAARITGPEVLEILNIFDIERDMGMQSNRKKLRNDIRKNAIKTKLNELGVEIIGNLTKDELYEKLYMTCIQKGTTPNEEEGEIEVSDGSVELDADQLILDQDTMDPQREYHITETSTGRQQNKGYMWNKGAFVSFVLNMEKQTRYLGMPRLIW